MAAIFKKPAKCKPPLLTEGGDPFEAIDEKLVEGLKRDKITDECRSIDWLPKELKELVDKHKPGESDVDTDGNVNLDGLAEEATKLFTVLKNENFVNFYQLAQLATRFSDAWGFVLSTQNNYHLACFYSKSSRQPCKPEVSPGHQRSKSSLKGDCPFVVKASCDQSKKDEPRHRRPVRVTDFTVKHTCKPGVAEVRLAKKAAGAVYGQIDLQEIENTIDLVVTGELKPYQIRNLLRKHIPSGYEVSPDDLRNFKERAMLPPRLKAGL